MGDPRVSLVNRMFGVDARNRLWVGDITYIGTSEGWLYTAAVIDAWHRKVVGWSMSSASPRNSWWMRARASGRQSPADFSHSCSMTIRASGTRPAHSALLRSPMG